MSGEKERQADKKRETETETEKERMKKREDLMRDRRRKNCELYFQRIAVYVHSSLNIDRCSHKSTRGGGGVALQTKVVLLPERHT